MTIESCFGKQRVLVGVIHLTPLPGSPGYGGDMTSIVHRALEDATALEAGGLDGAIVENFGDVPFFPERVPPETVAAMATVASEIRRAVRFPLGINVLRNDAHAALAVAASCGARFIRVNVHTGASVTDQGIVSGRAYVTLRLRDSLWSRSVTPPPLVFADLDVKHATSLAATDLARSAEDTFFRGLADVLLVTGSGTGKEISFVDLQQVRRALPEAPVLVASGVTDGTVARIMREAQGAIVGTWLKRDGKVHEPVDRDRVRALVAASRSGLPVERQGG